LANCLFFSRSGIDITLLGTYLRGKLKRASKI
jgi:hypothetical protein